MADQRDDEANGNPLNERILDLLIYIPAGIAVSVADEIPKLAVRGRERLGVRVSSARAVGMFAVKAGRNEFGPAISWPGQPGRGPLPGRRSGLAPGIRCRAATRRRTASAGATIVAPHLAGKGKRARAGGVHPVHPGFRHPVRLPGGPAPRRPQPGRVGVGPRLRGVHPGSPHNPQSGRPAPR